MADTSATRPGQDTARTPSPAAAGIGATGGLDLDRFQQEVAEEIGLGPDALSRLANRAQAIDQLEQQSHFRR